MPQTPTIRSAHPIELIAAFRRWRPSPLRDLIYTALWNSMIGVALTFAALLTGSSAPFLRVLTTMLLTANMVGFAIHLTLGVLHRLVPASVPGRRSRGMLACELLLMACCIVFGIAAANALLRGRNPLDLMLHTGVVASLLPYGILSALLMVAVLAAGERRVAREVQEAQQQEKIAEAGRLLAEARLRTLQAQIEPHFLYNTLANVVSLIGSEPDRARHMLERLIDFLRASLAASRAGPATLGAELDLAASYLDLLAVRMGARLRWRVEAGEDCRALPVAPMLLQPLVENAVMHGVEPKVDGGEITVRALRDGDMLRVEVSDNGMGLGATAARPGGGVGLSNLRERLRSLHGSRAQLQLLENEAAGVTSRLLLPLEPV